MATLTGQPIVTYAARSQMLSGTMVIDKLELGSGSWTPTASSDNLNTLEQTVSATGALEAIAGGGYRLHITGTDGSSDAYDLKEFAVTDAAGVALIIYSQATVLDSKGSGSSLVFSIDLTIEEAPVDSISITGDTDFQLPNASKTIPGIIEIATDAEATAGADTVRAVTPYQAALVKAQAVAEATALTVKKVGDTINGTLASSGVAVLSALFEELTGGLTTSTDYRQLFKFRHGASDIKSVRFYLTPDGIEISINATYQGGGIWTTVDANAARVRFSSGDSGLPTIYRWNSSDGVWDETFSLKSMFFIKTWAEFALRDGSIEFTNVDTLSNPAPATAITNKLVAKNINKAWGRVNFTNNTASVWSGINVASAARVGTSDYIKVTFAAPMANALYAPTVTVTGGGAGDAFPVVGLTYVDGFTFTVVNPVTGRLDLDTDSLNVAFSVHGEQ